MCQFLGAQWFLEGWGLDLISAQFSRPTNRGLYFFVCYINLSRPLPLHAALILWGTWGRFMTSSNCNGNQFLPRSRLLPALTLHGRLGRCDFSSELPVICLDTMGLVPQTCGNTWLRIRWWWTMSRQWWRWRPNSGIINQQSGLHVFSVLYPINMPIRC